MVPLHKKQLLLLQSLLNQDVITSKQLSLICGISIRTVKSYIQELNVFLAPYNIQIHSQSGKGYWIEKTAYVRKLVLSLCEHKAMTKDEEIPKFNYERINYLIKKLLVVDYHIKLEDLMDEIYVSRSTLTHDLKEVRKRLGNYRLKVVSYANYGIILEGNEIDKRLCICEYFFHYHQKANYKLDSENIFHSGRNKGEYEQIVSAIREVCRRYAMQISDFSLNNMAIHVSIAMRRCTFYDYVKVEKQVVERFTDTLEFKAAKDLCRYLEKQFHCMLPIGETIYYAMHFQSKRIRDENFLQTAELQKLRKCIGIIYAEVKNNFDVQLDCDTSLYSYLLMHIPQMIQRLNNHMVIRNPLVYDNLRRYLFATKVTHSAVAVIEQMYEVDVDINEFGFLLLYFNMAILRQEHQKKMQIRFVSGRGRPEAIMYYNEIQEAFSNTSYQVEILDKEDLSHHQEPLDLLITTFTLDHPSDVPVYLIHNDMYLDEIRETLNHLPYRHFPIHLYFRKEYSCFHLPGTSKETVLQHMYELFLKRGYLTRMPSISDGFKADELGNGIVHFQDLHRQLHQGMCFIAVLKHPVLWEREVVRVCILIKTKQEGDKDLPVLCRLISHWANQVEKVERLIAKQDYALFLEDIQEVS